jgi:hypothetical protein
VHNPAEKAYDITVEIWRGAACVWNIETELILSTRRFNEHGIVLEMPELEPKTHTVAILLIRDCVV